MGYDYSKMGHDYSKMATNMSTYFSTYVSIIYYIYYYFNVIENSSLLIFVSNTLSNKTNSNKKLKALQPSGSPSRLKFNLRLGDFQSKK